MSRQVCVDDLLSVVSEGWSYFFADILYDSIATGDLLAGEQAPLMDLTPREPEILGAHLCDLR